MILIMVHKPLKPGFADAVEVQKHLLADGLRPIKEAVRWTSFSFFPDCFNRRKSLNVC